MILVDATGYGDNGRFDRIDAGIEDLILDNHTAMVINKSIGNAAFNHTLDALRERRDQARHSFPVDRLCLGHLDDCMVEELRKASWLNQGGILVVDEAEQLDRLPQIAAMLRERESDYMKIIYIVTVPVSSATMEASAVIED